jgi:hypothetical protein
MIEGEPIKSLTDMRMEDLRAIRKRHGVTQALISTELAILFYPGLDTSTLGAIEREVVQTIDGPDKFKRNYLTALKRIAQKRRDSLQEEMEERRANRVPQ